MMKDQALIKKIIITIALLLIAVLSVTVAAKYATSPSVHASTIEVLDEKKLTALGLTPSVTVTSAAISAIPGDAATPIAEQISELTTPLLIVVCAIYLEKFLLTTMGYISFDFLIPIACVLLCIYTFCKKDILKMLAIKLSVFAIAISLIIPVSVKVSTLIEATFEESISKTFKTVNEISEEAEETSDDGENSNGFLGFLSEIGDKVTQLGESAKNALSVFIDAIAVLIITTCVIPIAVIFFFVWIIKIIFQVNIDVSSAHKIFTKKTSKN